MIRVLIEIADELQWSHGVDAVETEIIAGWDSPREPLQWSHGVDAVETLIVQDSPDAALWLQWSHGVDAVETSQRFKAWN